MSDELPSRRNHTLRSVPSIARDGRMRNPDEVAQYLPALIYFPEAVRYVKTLKFNFTQDLGTTIFGHWFSWNWCYTPLCRFPSNALVLDTGAGQGEMILFFHRLGFRNFRCVDLNWPHFSILQRDMADLKACHHTLYNRWFEASDLYAVDFAKVDVEGVSRNTR